MTDAYKYQDRKWEVQLIDGTFVGYVSVHAQDVQEAHENDDTLQPSTHEDEILNNAVWKVLDNHKLQPEDIQLISVN
jgi:hypothetical protein